MIIMEGLEQGTRAWIQERLGVITASAASKMLTPKGALSAQRKSLVCRLAAERVLNEPVDAFDGTYWTERGKEFEGEAGAYFELMTGLKTRPVGFVYKDASKRAGCSPDWLVYAGDAPTAGVEVKCPKAETHVQYLLYDDDVYTQQVQFSLWVTGLPSWYFLSYYPGLRPVLKQEKPLEKWMAAFDDVVPQVIAEIHEAEVRLREAI